ncbi:MAG: dihydrolipoamide acetyltransferase family protein [Gudongella sp.]|nr:dihydrolipoamide acetyltransferase family protein [Gudongella sp.]
MAKIVVMPKLGLTMKEGKLVKWYKQEGDKIKSGDKLFSIETDKITNDAEATTDGILRKIIITAGKKVPIMEPVAIMGGKDEDIESLLSELTLSDDVKEVSTKKEEQKVETKEIPKKKESGEKVRISPVARKLAEEESIDYENIEGTGPKGRIVLGDVEKAIEDKKKVSTTPTATAFAQQMGIDIGSISKDGRILKDDIIREDKQAWYNLLASPTDTRKEMSTMRKIIGERMSESAQTAPAVNFTISVDTQKLKELRSDLNKDAKITYTDLIIKITSNLLLKHPMLNASIEGEEIITRNYVNMGVAVALPEGLLVPVLRNAHVKEIREISEEIKDLSYRAKTNQLLTDEIEGGTFTITNIGMFGIESFTPIINQPESAILGINAIIEEPKVIDGCICIRPMMKLSLTADHRTVDGAVAAIFLSKLKEALENPIGTLL